MKRRLWLVDQLLRDGVGHHAGYNRCLAVAAAEAGLEPVVVGHRDLDPRLLAPHRVERVFRTDWRANPPSWASANQQVLRGLEKISRGRFRADLRRLDRLATSADLVFAQMIAPRHLIAWLDWMNRPVDAPRLALHLGYQPHRFADPDVARAWASIPEKARAKITLVTDSEKLVEPLEKVFGAGVLHLPHVVEWNFARAGEHRRSGAVVLLAPGNARREKGFADLVAATSLIGEVSTSEKLVFRIQCHHPDRFCRELLFKHPTTRGLEWVDRELDDNAYVHALESCDVVVLPYHLDHYAARTSGVFCEARVAGKPVVATRGSWAGDRVAREGGGWLCEEKDPVSLARVLCGIGGDLGSEAQRAADLQEASRREFCARHFIGSLLRMAWPA